MSKDILIVDDEAVIRESVSAILEDEGYVPRLAADADQALREIAQRQPSLVLLDIWLEGSRIDGMEVLDVIQRDHPAVPVLVISGHGSIETAVTAIKKGAYDFIEKPFKTDKLLILIERAVEAQRLRRENEELRLRAGGELTLIGGSIAMQKLRQLIERVAPTNARVLIAGAPGSGKEVVAREIHQQSRRDEGPFVVLNAANMAPDRIEVELFGAEAGFGGADRPKMLGLFEKAHGGTLLLDEVADMPLETQGKILRVLQEQSFIRPGGENRVNVDVRVLACTNKDLKTEIDAGRFRGDLFYRLSVVPMQVPSLAERRQDIPPLVDHFMARAAEATGLPPRRIGDEAMTILQSTEWPGNVRQLRNAVEWMLIMAPGAADQPIDVEGLPPDFIEQATASLSPNANGQLMTLRLREARLHFERSYLQAQLDRFGGNISRTANFVGMERSALHRKLKSLNLHNDD